MKYSCSGVILSGGLNTRFAGKEKALMRIGNKQIFDRIYDVFKDIFDEIILVSNHPLRYLGWDVFIGSDVFSARCSLTGVHAGLFYSKNPYTFFTACDTPFLNRNLIDTLVGSIESGIDVVIPQTSKGLEPLCAVYSDRCIKPVEQSLGQNQFKIQSFFPRVKIKKIPEAILREKDPDLVSFYNINSPGDLDLAEKMIKLK
ncbi:MAG: molybdenum cofactor guanylyltransferase [Desulfobacterales bacterium]|nr:molybdenum cofactor guanylyltransferase [Desulfobacterales bacterium]